LLILLGVRRRKVLLDGLHFSSRFSVAYAAFAEFSSQFSLT